MEFRHSSAAEQAGVPDWHWLGKFRLSGERQRQQVTGWFNETQFGDLGKTCLPKEGEVRPKKREDRMTVAEQTKKREEIIRSARQLAEEYRSDDNLIACYITGSFANGRYRKYSDIDLHFVFRRIYKKEYAVYGRIFQDTRFDLIFDDVQTADDSFKRQFGNDIDTAITIWDKEEFIRDRREKYGTTTKFGFIPSLQQKRSLRYKCLNYLMDASSSLSDGDHESALYTLKKCVDEIVQIERLVISDPHWNQCKTNLEWLRGKGNEEIYDIFRTISDGSAESRRLDHIVRRIALHVNGLRKLEKWLSLPLF